MKSNHRITKFQTRLDISQQKEFGISNV